MQLITHRQLFFQHVAQTSDFPLALEIDRAEGVYIYSTARLDGPGLDGPGLDGPRLDSSGPDGSVRRYMDLISGIGVSNVGHRHPQVIDAIREQLDKYLHLMVYGEFVQTPQTQLARALAGTLPYPLTTVYFTNSGTEAVEGAMKLAKRYTGRAELVSCINAYHGSTQGALSLSGDENFKRNYRPLLPATRHIRYDNVDDLSQITSATAGVVMEVVGGEAGVRVPDPAYLRAVRQRCTEVGALLIFDEIQTGFGRTGTFWAFEGIGAEDDVIPGMAIPGRVIPDILLCAKGMGGGMPIGAFISSAEIMQVLRNNPILGHITTFGGHPVSCAASLATLRVIQDERLHEQAVAKGQLFRQLLVHPAIRAVRGKGLMLAVEFDSFEVLKPIIDRAIELGVITDWFLFCNNAMRIAPPLIITDDQIREACAVILQAIQDVMG